MFKQTNFRKGMAHARSVVLKFPLLEILLLNTRVLTQQLFKKLLSTKIWCCISTKHLLNEQLCLVKLPGFSSFNLQTIKEIITAPLSGFLLKNANRGRKKCEKGNYNASEAVEIYTIILCRKEEEEKRKVHISFDFAGRRVFVTEGTMVFPILYTFF